MPVLQAMDGKFYDIPDDQASEFEVPREKVKELLEKSGAPAAQGAPGPAQGPGQMPGGQGPGPGQGAPPPSVLVQIYGAQPSYAPPPGQQMQQQPPPSQQGEPAQGGGDGDVNPYWWWRNITFYRPWGNFWPNWGNW